MYKPKFVRNKRDLRKLKFIDGYALAEIDVESLKNLTIMNAERCESPRLYRVRESVRSNGYNNSEPILASISKKGTLVIHDGGHRITAAQQVHGELLSNLFSEKVTRLVFLIQRTRSLHKKIPSRL